MRITQRWHRWGRFHWWLGSKNTFGWRWFRYEKPGHWTANFGGLFLSIWRNKAIKK